MITPAPEVPSLYLHVYLPTLYKVHERVMKQIFLFIILRFYEVFHVYLLVSTFKHMSSIRLYISVHVYIYINVHVSIVLSIYLWFWDISYYSPVYEMSIYEMSNVYLWNFRSMKFPFMKCLMYIYEMSCLRNCHLWNVLSMKCPSLKCPSL